MLAAALVIFACTNTTWAPDDVLKNAVVHSSKGRYTAVIRQYDGIPDFESVRAAVYYETEHPVGRQMTVAWYEDSHLLREVLVDRGMSHILLADSGYLVALRNIQAGLCAPAAGRHDTVVIIDRADGTRVGSLEAGDILTERDLLWRHQGGEIFGLRGDWQERQELVLSFDTRKEWSEPSQSQLLRIDLATAKLFDRKRDVYPPPDADSRTP